MADIIQGTLEWHQLRLGKVTASKVADVIAKTKSGYAATRANYAAQLITERLTGRQTEGFTNAAMAWGTEVEPEARAAYEFNRAETVVEVPFVPHPSIADTGASPDGLVGENGLVEIKCPLTATHIETLRGGTVPGKYVTQMMWQMACTGRKWCDFVSYDPRMPESMRFFCQRVERDDAVIAELEREVVIFLNEVRGTVAELLRRYEPEDRDPMAELLMAGVTAMVFRITDETVHAAFDALELQARPAAEARAMRERRDDERKAARARAFRSASGSVAEREAAAILTDDYREACERYYAAIEADEEYRNIRSKCEAIIEAWRTCQSNFRAMGKVA